MSKITQSLEHLSRQFRFKAGVPFFADIDSLRGYTFFKTSLEKRR